MPYSECVLAVFAVILALAGAPANTPVSCLPHLSGGNRGLAYIDDNPMRIEVTNGVCLAAQYAGATRQERNQIAAANPKLVMFDVLGSGLLDLLHEAEHVALRSRDECQVEKAAYAKVRVLLRRFAPRLYPLTTASAARRHFSLPPSYRGC